MESSDNEPRKSMPCDLLIRNASILTLDAERRFYSDGAIAIKSGAIVGIGPASDVSDRFVSRDVLDARGGLVHPGFVDGHVHLSITTARGAFPDSYPKPFQFYTRWWDALTDDDEYLSSLLTCLELVRNGTTCFMEAGTVLQPDAAARAAETVGIRASLGDPFLWDVDGGLGGAPIGRAPIDRGRAFRLLGGQLSRNQDPNALVRGHVALYGIGTQSDELLLAAEACAASNGVRFNQHQSYTAADVAVDDARFGEPAMLHFQRIGALSSNSTFTHMNVVRDDEVPAIAASHLSMTWCLTSSMIKGHGGTLRDRHDEFHKMGIPVAFGTDSANSALRFDLSLQAVLAVLTAREKRSDRTALRPEDALEMATLSGAHVIGLADQIGSLEIGKKADIVIRRADAPECQPQFDPVQSLMLSQGSSTVDTVVVNGRVVVRGGQSTLVDEERAYALARESARRLVAVVESRFGSDSAELAARNTGT